MKKFRSIGIVVVMASLVVSLAGCISAPPEGSVPPQEGMSAGSEQVTTASGEGGESQEATSEVTNSQENKEGVKLVVKAANSEFSPKDDAKKAMTGDLTTLGFNYIYAMDETDQAVADALSAGHFYSATTEDAPVIELKEKELMMGDQLSLANNKSLKVEISKLKSGSVVKVISNEGIIEEKKVMGSEYSKRVSIEKEGFCFVEVWSGDGQLLAVTNPMYVTP